MKTTILYFSATGNSIVIARKLAKNMENAEVVSIVKMMKNDTIKISSEKVGIIIPVYAWGAPRIVMEFLKKLELNHNQYIFAIAHSGGIAGYTLKQMNRALSKKGIRIHAGFSVKDASYAGVEKDIPVRIAKALDGKGREKMRTFIQREDEIRSVIGNNELHKVETTNFMVDIYTRFMHGIALELFKKRDSKFAVTADCSKCDTCVKICPQQNIIRKDSGLVWQHNCEMCLACLKWCPKKAIELTGDNMSYNRRHNNQISIKDFL